MPNDPPRLDGSHLENMIALAVENGVRRAFVTLGVDLMTADGVTKYHTRNQFIDEMREREESGGRLKEGAYIGVFTAAVSAFVAWFVSRLPAGH
jgi:hypothetical protein